MNSSRNGIANHTPRRQRGSRQPRFDRTGNRSETFDQRRATARSLPAAYTQTWAQEISDLMDRDAGAATYFGLEFWTKAPWGADSGEVTRRIQYAGQRAALDIFPTLKRSSRNRIPASMSIAAIVLPAQRRDGIPHVHGFLRVP